MRTLIILLLLLIHSLSAHASPRYRLGTARSNITGPVYGPLLMGYATPGQNSTGIHMPLYSRAIILANPSTDERLLLLNLDLSTVTEVLRREVLAGLRQRYGNRYQDHNVLMTATHTHASISGLSHYFLYVIASLGFEPENLRVVVQGILDSVEKADATLQETEVLYSSGDLRGLTHNRSLEPYRSNPEAASRTDTVPVRMDQILFSGPFGTLRALFNVFAIHGTSWSNQNHLVSGDSKGWAAYELEHKLGILASFANGAAGDASPVNLGRGSQDAEYAALREVSRAQSSRAEGLLSGALPLDVEGSGVSSALLWQEMPGMDVGQGRKLCEPSIGISMIAGAEDGRGILPGLREGMTRSSGDRGTIFARTVLSFLKKLTGLREYKSDRECQGEKPSLFHTWSSGRPGTPRVLPFQLVRIGRVVLAATPFEATTVSGQRIRESLLADLIGSGVDDVVVVGYANAYSGYLATPEEYELQHYEGASTHFGPYSLVGVQASFSKLARLWKEQGAGTYGTPPARTPIPDWKNERSETWDRPRPGSAFGRALQQPSPEYSPGMSATARFEASHPQNDPVGERAFLEVQRWTEGTWQTVFTDADPETAIEWRRPAPGKDSTGDCTTCFEAELKWWIPQGQPEGRYRFRFLSRALVAGGRYVPYSGLSEEFRVGSASR